MKRITIIMIELKSHVLIKSEPLKKFYKNTTNDSFVEYNKGKYFYENNSSKRKLQVNASRRYKGINLVIISRLIGILTFKSNKSIQ